MLEEKVLKTIRKFDLIKEGSKVLVALSGGPDSVTLLRVLLDLKDFLRIEIFAGHLNHMLRGEESLRDEQFVKDLCREWNVPIFVERIDVPSASRGKNVEAVARSLRYGFLRKILGEIKGDVIATGHTASDLAETILLCLAKGTGIRGLRGFLPARDGIVRPLFEVSRDEVMEYVKAKGIPYVVDSSNFSLEYERNLIRHKVLPVLREINPSLEQAFLRTADIVRSLESFLEEIVSPFLERGEEERFCIFLEDAGKLHPFILGELLRRAFERISGRSLSYDKVNAILSLINKKGFKRVDVGGGIVAFKDQEKLCLAKRQETPCFSFKVESLPAVVKTPSAVLVFRKNEGVPVARWSEFIERGIVVRSRIGGERLIYRGFSRPLKKVLIEKKVPVEERARIPLVLVGDRVVFVPGIYRAPVEVEGEDYVGVEVEGTEGAVYGASDKGEGSGTCG